MFSFLTDIGPIGMPIQNRKYITNNGFVVNFLQYAEVKLEVITNNLFIKVEIL
jgi:hypothetical protein